MTSADLQMPSPLSMDVLVPSEFLTIPIPTIQHLLQKYPELQRLYNHLLISSFSMHWEIKLTLCRSSAMEKYQWFYESTQDSLTRLVIDTSLLFLG